MEEKFKEENEQTSETPEKELENVEFTNDADVDAVVDRIVNEESDELLKAEDDARQRFAPPEMKSLKSKLKGWIVAWWDNKHLRYGTFAGIALLFIISIFIPFTRYAMLNLVGARVSSSLTVLDITTGLPLENIPVQLQGTTMRTDEDGYVSFTKLKQGPTTVMVDKRGYALYENKVTLGWGSNRLDNQEITATGARFTFTLQDWVTEKSLEKGEASSGEDIAQTNDDGQVTITIGEIEGDTEVVLSAEGYRDERLRLNDINSEEQTVKMVPAKQHVFVSNRDGQYDLYKIYVDGKNEEILLKASGKEREVPFVLPSQTKNIAAYVSSRDGDINKDGFVLDGLFIIDVINGDSFKVTRSEQLQVIGWSGDKLLYVAVVEGVSAGNSNRSKLFSYDVETKERKEIASSNYFNDVKLVNDTVYYATSSFAVPQSQAKLFSINVDGDEKKTVVDSQVWSIKRENYETLLFNAVDQQWFQQTLEMNEVKKLEQQPPNQASRIYSVSPNGEKAVWVDVRDGKGVLLNYDIGSKKEEVRLTQSGLNDPVYWLNDEYIVFRVETGQETADYILHVNEGEPRKIADVIGNRSRYFY